jgi:hypothetical protein
MIRLKLCLSFVFSISHRHMPECVTLMRQTDERATMKRRIRRIRCVCPTDNRSSAS